MEPSNLTYLEESADPKTSEDIGDSTMFYMGLVLKMYLNPVLSVGGIFINLINTVIFYKMGLSDGVTQNFLILSIFDGILAVAATINSTCYILLQTVFSQGGSTAEDLQTVLWSSLIAWPVSQIVSCTTTTVIAVVRCCCVALPLRVKQVLTARRQLAAIVFFSASFDGIIFYVYSSARFVRIALPPENITNVFILGADYSVLNIFTNIFFYLTYIIVIICLFILSINLSRATKFRDQSTTGISEKPKEKTRETRVVQTVTLVSAIFVLYNLPTIVLSVIRQTVEGFSSHGHRKNLYRFFLILVETAMLLNVDVNIFIYFSYNTRYRNIFTNIFASSSNKT